MLSRMYLKAEMTTGLPVVISYINLVQTPIGNNHGNGSLAQMKVKRMREPMWLMATENGAPQRTGMSKANQVANSRRVGQSHAPNEDLLYFQ